MTDNEDWRDQENPEKNPNALTYGITPSAPASITPIDIDKWKGKVAPTFKQYFTERYAELVRQYEELVGDYHTNKMMYESAMGFEPVIGHIYYLYQRNDGSTFISLIEPEHTHWNYIGSFRFNAQYAWEKVIGD